MSDDEWRMDSWPDKLAAFTKLYHPHFEWLFDFGKQTKKKKLWLYYFHFQLQFTFINWHETHTKPISLHFSFL